MSKVLTKVSLIAGMLGAFDSGPGPSNRRIATRTLAGGGLGLSREALNRPAGSCPPKLREVRKQERKRAMRLRKRRGRAMV
jgi:hypothetical protein